jgi:hypothetical protein
VPALSSRVGELRAVADPPDGYMMQTVRLSGGVRHGEVIGTINPHLDGLPLWVALRPPVEGHQAGTSEDTATKAVGWLLRELVRGESEYP